MHLSAKADYALRATIHLAGAPAGPVKSEVIAAQQEIPQQYLESILGELRRSGFVVSQRGAHGGYWLSRPASEISVADIVRTIDGPLTTIRGKRPEDITYATAAEPLGAVWRAARNSLRDVLEAVSLADVVTGTLPHEVHRLSRLGLD
ncbi:Rrf2 family transcriptional regulator [Pseudonocardia ailaonensis]|uniref:Rrf2 family transcriptional regulator n=1 Tax=Pseudonocardia ailaonensis TaxID=367279 RepID=A0ABN2MIT2_9PSEU